jgi:lysine 2,3-aminomutase
MTHRSAATRSGARVVPLEEAARRLGAEWDALARRAASRLPLRFPEEYLRLADPDDPNDPIRAIAWPEAEEVEPDPDAIDDPVGERDRGPHPLVVLKHADRVILIATKRCHFYCRFCFRAGAHAEPARHELEEAVAVIARHRAIREVILSGGDPLTLPDERLAGLLARLARVPFLETLRIHTRAPVHAPHRVTPELIEALAAATPLPLRIVLHASHPRELRPSFDAAIDRLASAGHPLLDQTVLLRGVNDDPETLEALFNGLYRRKVVPYYLHHPDRIAGTARFRVPIERGRQVYRTLRGRLAGAATPGYVLDLPDGRGKVPVLELEPLGRGRWRYVHPDGAVSTYDDIPA